MRAPRVVASLRGTSYIGMPENTFPKGPRMKRLLACLLMLATLFVPPTVSAQKVSERGNPSARSRRVLYNFDGDSCMTRKAGTKQP